MNTNKRNIRNITELTNKMAKCECGGLIIEANAINAILKQSPMILASVL